MINTGKQAVEHFKNSTYSTISAVANAESHETLTRKINDFVLFQGVKAAIQRMDDAELFDSQDVYNLITDQLECMSDTGTHFLCEYDEKFPNDSLHDRKEAALLYLRRISSEIDELCKRIMMDYYGY